jgi:hypothetical protein
MKTNVNRLSFIDVDLFYTISIWNSEISLQGHLSSELIKYCKDELSIDLKPNEEGWLHGVSNSIEFGLLKVTLT